MIRVASQRNSSVQFLGYLSVAVVVTTFLFYFMAYLISGGKSLGKSSDSENVIEFVRIKRPTQTELRKRKLPKKPELKEQPKATKSVNMKQKSVTPNRPDMKFDTPQLDIPLALGKGGMGVNAGGGGAAQGSDEMPLVRVEPQFPREALSQGIEQGWVRIQFDLNPDGTVSDARVVDSSPRDVFDLAARRAVLKWKYRPKIVKGKGVKRTGLKVQLDFKMEQ